MSINSNWKWFRPEFNTNNKKSIITKKQIDGMFRFVKILNCKNEENGANFVYGAISIDDIKLIEQTYNISDYMLPYDGFGTLILEQK